MLLCACVRAGNITRTVIALRTADSFCHCLVSLCPLVTQPDLCGSEHRPRPPVPCLSDWLSSLFLHTLPPVSARLTVTAAVLPRLACLGEHSTLSVSLVWTQKTIDRWLCPVVRSDGVRNERRKKKKWTKGQSGCMKIRWREQTHTAAPHTKVTLCFHCTRRPKVTINIHCCRWVGLCRKAHWTMSATVAQICLTRVSANQSAGCEALWLFYLYFLFFTSIFSLLPPSPVLGVLRGKRRRDRDTNRLLAACLSSSSSPLIDGYVCSKGEGSGVNV